MSIGDYISIARIIDAISPTLIVNLYGEQSLENFYEACNALALSLIASTLRLSYDPELRG